MIVFIFLQVFLIFVLGHFWVKIDFYLISNVMIGVIINLRFFVRFLVFEKTKNTKSNKEVQKKFTMNNVLHSTLFGIL